MLNKIEKAGNINAINDMIVTRLASNIALVNEINDYLFKAGGKRIRPIICSLVAQSLDYKGLDHIKLAVIIEFIHTSTLLHDDVIDESYQRRGKRSINAIYGNKASILTGDFLYSRSFEMMSELKNQDIIEVLAKATNIISEGEILQLINCNDFSIDLDEYLKVIYHKTAKLFEASCETAAILSQKLEFRENFKEYGISLGICFQIIDDLLDYKSSTFGKNQYKDLEEGKMTLPLIYTYSKAFDSEKELIEKVISKKIEVKDNIKDILSMMNKYESFEYCTNLAKSYSIKAINAIKNVKDNKYKDILIEIAEKASSRNI